MIDNNNTNNTYDIYGDEKEFTEVLQGEQMEVYTTASLLTKANVPQVGGTIRPGVMALKKNVSAADVQLYNRLVAENATWNEIDKALGPDNQGLSKLRPLNVDYFTVHPADFINPENAQIILDRYADNDGKLRKFPVWFPFNNWWQIIFHNLAAFGKSAGIKYRSVFVEKREGDKIVGIERVCQFPAEYTEEEKGVRKCGPRDWNTRGCNPEACPEYQKQECRLRGRIYCYVPGVKGLNLIAIPTSSWYSLNRIKGSLDLVMAVTGGRIPSIIDGRPVFVIRKRKDKIPVIDITTGESRLREQYLIELDLDMDMLEIAQHFSPKATLAAAAKAQNMLTPPPQQALPQNAAKPKITSIPAPEIPEKVDTEKPDELPPPPPEIDDEQPVQTPATDKNDVGKGKAQSQTQPASEAQLNAIRTRAKKAGVPDSLIAAATKNLTFAKAAEMIGKINKNDFQFFVIAADKGEADVTAETY